MLKLNYDDFVLNLLIQVNQFSGRRIVSEIEIQKYKSAIYKKSIQDRIRILFQDSRQDFLETFNDYKDLISLIYKNDKMYIAMNPYITYEDLINRCRGYLPLNLLLLLTDTSIINHILANSVTDEMDEILYEYYSSELKLHEHRRELLISKVDEEDKIINGINSYIYEYEIKKLTKQNKNKY